MPPRFLILLLAGVAPAPLLAQTEGAPIPAPAPVDEVAPAAGADAAAQPDRAPDPDDPDLMEDEEDGGEAIVVTGQRPRGSVDSDIPPEIQLDRRDIRATGAGTITELLDAIAPQTRSGRGREGGGRPVVLLNGQRISGFGEIRDLPPEAIERVDILPEEVALRYGYRADQRVVNIVLRRRFDATTGELEGGFATAGGRGSYEIDLNHLRIDPAGRYSLDFEYQHSDPLFESERDIIQAASAPADIGRFRTLLAESDQLTLGGTINRSAFGDVSATLNGRFDTNWSTRFLGPDPSDDDALRRESDGRTAHVGLILNGNLRPWRWSLTSNYDNVLSTSRTDTGIATTPDRTRTLSSIGTTELVTSGPLFDLPGGEVSATVRAGFDTRDFSSTTRRNGIEQSRDLSRDRGAVQASIDLPIASRRRAFLEDLGNLSVNFNAEIEQLSDFGTLTTLGAGLNWSPIEELNFGASFTDEDGAPSMQQLGDPVQETPGVRVFDLVRGETVDITRIEGGNPNLLADNRRVLSLRMNARPFEDEDLTFLANYTSSRIDNAIASFPTATPEIEAAFPGRFLRDVGGRLLQIDGRPVNFARTERSEVRWGINFSEPIGPQRPAGGFRRGGGRGAGAPGGALQAPQGEQPAGQPPQVGQPGQPPQPGPQGEAAQRPRGPGGGGGFRGSGGGGGRGGFGGGGMGGGGRFGGRLQLGLFHTYHISNEILIREGVPVLDLLDGSAVGGRGGQPRHEVEAQAGLFKNGIGARLTANWQSGTTVHGRPDLTGASSGDLSFSDFTTVNLRLFADLGARRDWVREVPFLRGMRVTLAIDNLFDSRIDVRDSTGATPLSYQDDYLDPLGRSVRISLRKLFF
ncbi:MAG TPA: TonB-dependent receptor [Allosphingosinicella sp.]|nr:TonB-dependent receptor [Allosphingosinicella sp.]